ncbi:hypothetical protein Tco_0530487 [Tanacetum coccineum]
MSVSASKQWLALSGIKNLYDSDEGGKVLKFNLGGSSSEDSADLQTLSFFPDFWPGSQAFSKWKEALRFMLAPKSARLSNYQLRKKSHGDKEIDRAVTPHGSLASPDAFEVQPHYNFHSKVSG